MVRGKFITLEGIEGAGKSTALAAAREFLADQGIDLMVTREPGGTELAERIRNLLLDPANKGMSPDCELLLVFAARAEHLHRHIEPALESGRWVLCDRFTDATRAYQGGGRGLDSNTIESLAGMVQRGTEPDLTLLFDLPVEVGLARAGSRSKPDRIEQEKAEFFEQVRQRYLELAETWPERIRLVDASQTPEEVATQVRRQLRGLLQ